MSSTNNIYKHLSVQKQPKSILKKSPSPKFQDTSINSTNEYYSYISPLSTIETKQNNIDNSTDNCSYECTLSPNQSVEKDNTKLSNVIVKSLDKLSKENSSQYNMVHQLQETILSTDSSSSVYASDDEQERIKIKSKKNYYRPFIVANRSSSSESSNDNNDKGKARRPMVESPIHSNNNYRKRNMQLDEFIHKYHRHEGTHLSTKKDRYQERIITKDLINNNKRDKYHHLSLTKNFRIDEQLMNKNEKINLLSKSRSPLQFLFDIACTSQFDCRTKIDRIRQYVEEQIGISAFLTVYKLIKSSRIPINIRQKPFCFYANFIPHLCCLIILESEQQTEQRSNYNIKRQEENRKQETDK